LDFVKDKQKYEEVVKANTIEACEAYLTMPRNEVIVKNYVDEVKHLKKVFEREIEEETRRLLLEQRAKEEAEKWRTDDLAWNEATSRNTSIAFKKYLELYPTGKRVQQATKLVIDREVDEIFGKDHGRLPAMDKTSQGQGSTSRISVYNNTAYILTLRYSGTESKIIDIPSRSRQSISLSNGNYRIAASVNAANVRNYAGSENLTGGNYDVEYYISSSSSTYKPHYRP